jgi:hypothetical protein
VDGQEGEAMGTRRIALLLGLTLGLATAIGLAGPVNADPGGRSLSATLLGANEIPGPGDPDGTGTALITLNQGQGTVCFELSVENITLPATGAHIHVGTATEAGAIVVGLTPPGADGTSSGCVENVDRALIKAIRQDPAAYYVNVHTLPDFGAGAVRGQLSK